MIEVYTAVYWFELHWSINFLLNVFTLFYIVYLGIHSLQPILALKELKKESEEVIGLEVEEDSTKTAPKKLDENVFSELKTMLEQLMHEEKIFLDETLTIWELAKKMNTNSKYLSIVINQGFNRSFNHYINGFRIDLAKEMLVAETAEKLSIEGIGYDVGFKSKSSFNTAFKRETGMSPSAYLKMERSKESVG